MGPTSEDSTRSDDGASSAAHGMLYAYRLVLSPGIVGLVLGIAGALVIMFAFIAPYGTRDTLLFHQRVFFHGLCGILATIVCYPPAVLTLYLARYQTRFKVGLALALQCLITAVPGSAISYTLYGLFHAGNFPNEGPLLTYLVSAATLGGVTATAYYVIWLISHGRPSAGVAVESAPDDERFDGIPAMRQQTIAAVVSTTTVPTAGAATENPPPVVSGTEADAERDRPPRSVDYPGKPRANGGLLTRIPASLGRDLVYIKVSGHYLEVVTTLGSAVIVQRFSDAVEELRDRGLQIHRSYWVAHAHIRRVVRRDYRTLLHLDGGYEVPVSRTFLPAVHHHATTRAAPPALGSDTD